MQVINSFTTTRKPGQFIDLDIVLNQNINQKKMKENQLYVFDNHLNSQNFIMSEPPGAGKSTTCKFVGAKLLKDNPDLKIVIAVPTTIIARNFNQTILEYPNEIINWDIGEDLCDDYNYESKSDALYEFLQKTQFSKNPSSRVAITTHVNLAKIADLDLNNIKNTMFIIDEAHHILSPINGEVITANLIGIFIDKIFKRNDPSIKMWLTTATFYRGDCGSIISPENFSKFIQYSLPLDEYWEKYINHINSFSYNFAIYKDFFVDLIPVLQKHIGRKQIHFCPYVGQLLNGHSKYEFRDQLIKTIKSVWPECRVADLIEEEDRTDVKKIIENNLCDVVLTLKLFDEGTDWPPAQIGFDYIPTNSLTRVNQRFGRFLRDIPGKEFIEYNSFFPHKSNFKDENERREFLTDSCNAWFATALLQEDINPIQYAFEKPKNTTTRNQSYTPFKDAVPDENIRINIMTTVTKNLMELRDENENVSIEDVKNSINQTLIGFNIVQNIDDISYNIYQILKRQSQQNSNTNNNTGVDIGWVREAGFDKIQLDQTLQTILNFTSGVCGVKTFKEFRDIYETGKRTPEEWVEIANMLAAENGGVLRYTQKYPGLQMCMKKYPELFAHLKRKLNNPKNTPEQWVEFANELVTNNIDLHKYPRLRKCMKKYPILFEHLKFEGKLKKTPEQWVEFAKELVAKNGGVLKNYSKKYPGLRFCIKKHPHLFEQFEIKRNDPIKTPEQWVEFAKELEAKNGGVLIGVTNYPGLACCMKTHPELFDKFKRKFNTCRTPEEWVEFANKLAAKNGGVLKITADLSALRKCMKKYPDLFAHIERK